MMFFGILIFVALVFGCIGGDQGNVNETKLEVTEGIGIVGTLKIDSLNPGLDGYISLTVRNNLGGETARDVTVSLDNLNPFKVYDCGGYRLASEERNCTGQFDLDDGRTYNTVYGTHKTSRLAPGEEIDVLWRIRAPNATEISNIALKHPVYYSVAYTYRTGFHQNVIFMSQQEQMRRRQAGEEYLVTGESGSTAGELRMSGSTQQPITFFFNADPGEKEQPFSFPLQFAVENQGSGIPLSDVVVLFEYPSRVAPDETEMTTYGWHKWNQTSDVCDSACIQNINTTFGDDMNTMDKDRTLYKVVKKEDFIKSFNIYIPLKLTGDELTELKESNIPLKIYTFRLFTMYTYFIEGKDYINVYPIRIKG